jgi:hypothetical protein
MTKACLTIPLLAHSKLVAQTLYILTLAVALKHMV